MGYSFRRMKALALAVACCLAACEEFEYRCVIESPTENAMLTGPDVLVMLRLTYTSDLPAVYSLSGTFDGPLPLPATLPPAPCEDCELEVRIPFGNLAVGPHSLDVALGEGSPAKAHDFVYFNYRH